jgi:hypothetical protein
MKLIAAALALALPLQDGKFDLRWKFEKGQALRYRTVQKNAIEAGGIAIEQEMSQVMSLTTAEVDDQGTGTLTVKYESLAARGSGLLEYDYDSEKDKKESDNPMVKVLANLVGQTFTMKVTPSGQVKEVKGFDKILEKMLAAGGDENSNMMFKQMLSDDTMKTMMQQWFSPLPAEKVAKGEAWSNDVSMPVPPLGQMKMTFKSRLADVKDGSAHIDQDIKIELVANKNAEALPIPVEMKDVKGKSTAVFSVEKGRFLSSKIEIQFSMAAAGQEFSVKTNGSTEQVEKK